jgi:hypothetical protein
VVGVIPATRIVVLHRFRGVTPRDTGRFHQPRDPLASNVDFVLQAQLGMEPRRPVHAPAGVVDLFDLLDEHQRLSQAKPENRNREGTSPQNRRAWTPRSAISESQGRAAIGSKGASPPRCGLSRWKDHEASGRRAKRLR